MVRRHRLVEAAFGSQTPASVPGSKPQVPPYLDFMYLFIYYCEGGSNGEGHTILAHRDFGLKGKIKMSIEIIISSVGESSTHGVQTQETLVSTGADDASWGRYHLGSEGCVGLGHVMRKERLF